MTAAAVFVLPATAADLTRQFGGKCVNGAEQITLGNIATLADAKADSLAFFNSHKYQDDLAATQAGVVVLHERHRKLRAKPAVLVDENVRDYIARVLDSVGQGRKFPIGIHPDAVIDATATLAQQVHVGAGAVIGANAKIGARSKVLARAVVADGCEVGADCILHEGCVVGAEGFGFISKKGKHRRITHQGKVIVGADVEIGANSCIDRGVIGDTVIGSGTKIDNLVQIGHNVKIGEGCMICGCTGIAGSAQIGADCVIGGAVSIADHVRIADKVTLYGRTAVVANITTAGAMYGSPAIFHLPIDKVKRIWYELMRLGKK